MKYFWIQLLIIAFVMIEGSLHAQGVVVTEDQNYTEASSAILDINSNNKGLLPPRMTTLGRDAIRNPATGLLIFNSSGNMLNLFNGTTWGTLTGEFVCGASQIVDDDGNIYSTVQIGAQCWMSGNLNIGSFINSSISQSNNSTIEKYCYDNDTEKCDTLGGLYQWDELMQYVTADSVRGICPENWHIPSDEEWSTLELRIDPSVAANTSGWRGTDAGTKLKFGESSGFDALFSGRLISGSFNSYNYGAYYWSSSEDPSDAWERFLQNDETGIARNNQNKQSALSVRCVYDDYDDKLPAATTGGVSDIGGTDANVAGQLTNLGSANSSVFHHGHCWSTSMAPTVADSKTDLGFTNSLDSFVSNLTGLTDNTTYYVRAYAENSIGITYGIAVSFLTVQPTYCPGIPTITYDGQVYNTVQVGSQCWLKENLNTGTFINSSTAQSNNGTVEKYCYENQTSNCDTYGAIYKWDEAMKYVSTNGAQGICPSGWHIPTDADWCTLENEVDAGSVSCSATGYRGIDAGSNLKEAGTSHWRTGSTGTNTSNFTALPGGLYSSFMGGPFFNIQDIAKFWSSTQDNTNKAWSRMLYYSNAGVNRGEASTLNQGYYIRCIKD